jgi:hypothetical protein
VLAELNGLLRAPVLLLVGAGLVVLVLASVGHGMRAARSPDAGTL